MPAVQRSKAVRSQAFRASRVRRRPQPAARGDWRSRVRHHPDPGGGGGNGNRTEAAPRVLIVDDEGAIRTICRVNLESDGLAVAEAVNGREALAVVRAQQPELVLLDVMMPDVDGWQVAAELGQDPATRDIPIVFLSARAAREDKARAQELGAVGYVVKPFDPIGLSASVRDVLDRIRRGEREQLNRELLAPE